MIENILVKRCKANCRMRRTCNRVFATLLLASVCFRLGAVTNLFDDDEFHLGCNYWASHAGVQMWRNWNPQQVESDLDDLAGCGITVLRVFPLWPDFQPLTAEYGGGQSFVGWTQCGGPLLNDAAVDEEMMCRFRFLCDAANKRGIKLVVGLITGWMSGRTFVPPGLERRNVVTDPAAIAWEVRFVRYFVNALKDHPAIIGWDLGNECNCLGGSAAELWCWMHHIASEIRVNDPMRPVISGMHSVGTTDKAQVNIRQQGELVDVLTTHPYPLWTPNCNLDPFDTMRNGCHPACETVFYSNLSGKLAFVEEAGSMGPGIVSEDRAAAAMRVQLFSTWACGIRTFVWWCAYDQDKLDFAPYDWTAIERELGLFKAPGEPKPTARTMRDFAAFLKTAQKLAPRQVDAVVLVSEKEQAWSVAQGAWLLAKKAGFDIAYAKAEGPLPKAEFYILPSGVGYETYSGRTWNSLREKVREGATALITLGDGAVLSGLAETAGVKTESHYERAVTRHINCDSESFDITDSQTREISLQEGCRLLLSDASGRPVMSEYAFGNGKVLFFSGALERYAPLTGWPVYRLAAKCAGVKRRVTRDVPTVGLTEHPVGGGTTVVVAINYEPRTVCCRFAFDGSVGRVLRGELIEHVAEIPANDALVFEVK